MQSERLVSVDQRLEQGRYRSQDDGADTAGAVIKDMFSFVFLETPGEGDEPGGGGEEGGATQAHYEGVSILKGHD